ncbi:hypothetical protein M3Y98_00019400 [Aphelenchoides besseyi]|nr:hypothetical protein M3Y98_00019400 [Aphelenchoides besseyi]KAI6199235.1 hypothetical protein M3Y96_00605200 [Aphelenchoides besseyi]
MELQIERMQPLYPTPIVDQKPPGLNTTRPFISTPAVDGVRPLCPELSAQIAHNRHLNQISSELKNITMAINELKYEVQQLKLKFEKSRVCVCSREPKTAIRSKYPLEVVPTSVLPSVTLGSSSTAFHDPISSIISLLSNISFDSETRSSSNSPMDSMWSEFQNFHSLDF